MNISAMILHVLQFADRPLSAEEIAAGIVSDFDERPTPEQVADSITSSLLPLGRVLVEDGRYRLPEDVPAAPIEEQIASLRLENTSILHMLAAGLDGCALSELLERLIDGVALDFAYAFHRGHLRRCPHCRDQFPELEHRFGARDAELLLSFTELLKGFSLIPPPGAIEFAANQAILAETGADPSDWDANAINDPQVEGVNHWLGNLASWRTLLLAASIGRELQVYSRTYGNAEKVWLDGRRGLGDAQAVEYIRALTDNQFTRILFAEECARMITEGRDIDAALLRGLFTSLTRIGSREFSFDEFNETYAPLMKFCESQAVDSDELLSTLLVKALEKADPDNADGQVETFAELKGMIREINDRIDSNTAVQLPVIDLLERIVRRLDDPSMAAAENHLRLLLGGRYSLLCPAAQTSLITAEQLSSFRDLGDPSLVIVAVAKAFESQLAASFLNPLCAFLKDLGLSWYPAQAEQRRSLLIRGRRNEKLMLGDIASVLSCGLPEVAAFARERGFDLPAVIQAIRTVMEHGGDAKHKHAFSALAAKQIKERWLRGEAFGQGVFSPLMVIDEPRAY